MAPSSRLARPLRIGMIGGGCVGGGVYELIMDRLGGGSAGTAGTLDVARTPTPIVTKICVRDASKPRDFRIDASFTRVVTDVRSILDDPEIDLVVEVAGGTTFARDAIYDALRSGKSVVTANKALIAENMDEIVDLLEAANAGDIGDGQRGGGKVRFGCEASVCGAIPIIHTLQTCYRGDVIHKVVGVLNGTTNYMLCRMEEGADYAEALQEAQDLGFAEADPTADVQGHDARAKIAILARLAFGTTVPVAAVPCVGITRVAAADFAYARSAGRAVRLVGAATRDGAAVSAYVSPAMVPLGGPLASAKGGGNAVLVDSANLGTASYCGPGAGRYPTANSVVADVLRAADGTCPAAPFPRAPDAAEVVRDHSSEFYIRVPFEDGPGVVRSLGELARTQGVSISGVLKRPKEDGATASVVVTTGACRLSQVEALCALVQKEEYALAPPMLMPLI